MNFRKEIISPIYPFKKGMKVMYIPHKRGHEEQEYERGIISSTNANYVFVRFGIEADINANWNNITAKACHPEDLVLLSK